MAPTAPDEPLDSTLARAAAGEPDAWRTLVDAYSKRVYGLLVRQCSDRELAEEITQATFVKVVGHLDRYHEQGKFEPWLFRIAMNKLRDEMRRRQRQARPMDMSGGANPAAAGGAGGESHWQAVQDRLVDRGATDSVDHEDPFERVSRAEQIEQMRTAIASMNEADRRILHLRHTAGLSFAQIAQTLGEPLGTVLARGHRALNKLRKLLLAEDDDSTPAESKRPGTD